MIITCAVFRGPRKRATEDTTPRALAHGPIVLTRPLSHLLHCMSQLLTSEVGHTISARDTVGLPCVPCFKSVHSSVMPCSVFPKPMSSAKMHPAPAKSRRPSTHSNMNRTPSRWCGRRNRTSAWSTFDPGLECVCGVRGLSSHSTRGSIPGGRARPPQAPAARRRASAARGQRAPGANRVGRAQDATATNRLRAARRRASSAKCLAAAPARPRNGREHQGDGVAEEAAASPSASVQGERAGELAWTLRALSALPARSPRRARDARAAAASKSRRQSTHLSGGVRGGGGVSDSEAATWCADASVSTRVRLRGDERPLAAQTLRGVHLARARGGERSRLQRKSTDDAASGFALRCARGSLASAGVSLARARRRRAAPPPRRRRRVLSPEKPFPTFSNHGAQLARASPRCHCVHVGGKKTLGRSASRTAAHTPRCARARTRHGPER